MSNVSFWLCPIISVGLLAVWLWRMVRQRHEKPSVQPSISQQSNLERVEAEDLLKIAYRQQEATRCLTQGDLACKSGLSESQTEQAIEALLELGWLQENEQGDLELTAEGETRGQELVRAHRLWERYLVDREEIPLEDVHAEAHRREHITTQEEMEALDAGLGHPAWDPHGHAIPGPGQRAASPEARTLWEAGGPGTRLRVVSVDDEPAALLAQLFAMGLKPGSDVEIRGRVEGLLHEKLDDQTMPLACAAARHIFAVPTPALAIPLGELPVGGRARVVEVKGGGLHQRRMLDMGFVPGANVLVIRRAPLGDPTEYRVKGSSVALRKGDTETVWVEELQNG